ncbi:MAG: alpha/beta hydrolase, partial [Nonomuraea sp.]|nr:alpha/beta hydrolase [Nonomuraea sp.]
PRPVVIVHGTDDERVPLLVSESYAAAHPAASLVRLPGAGHFVLIDPESEAWPAVLRELARLRPASVPPRTGGSRP